MKTYTIYKDGVQSSVDKACGMLKMWMQAAPAGEYVLTLEKRKQKRTMNQNKLMWLWFTIIAQAWSEATGTHFTSQVVHDAYCLKLISVSTPIGRVPGSTSSLDTKGMTDFLEQVRADAASEYGIELPDPEDDNFEDIRNYYNTY